jgi:hypothetical protein
MANPYWRLAVSFIRTEAQNSLRQYRGFILAGLIGMVGAYVLMTTFGTARLAGIFILVVAGLVGQDAYRRFSFPSGSGGPGVVEVDERQVSYLSSGGGASISLDSLDRVELHRNGRGRITWVFFGTDEMLSVPGDAEGTDKLFDALVALPGVNYDQAHAATQGKGSDLFLIWQKNRTKLH